MSSAAILAQIHALQGKINKLRTAKSYLKIASTSFGKFPPVLLEISEGWYKSIRINNKAADNGKAYERYVEFHKFISEIDNIIGVINAKIAEYEQEIEGLREAYWAAKKAEEEAAAKAKEAAGANHPSGIIYDLTSLN